MSCIAIIGGTGLSRFIDGQALPQLDTPFGALLSPVIDGVCGEGATPVLFLPRHGNPHRVPPDRVNYRANLWALREAGARQIVAVNAVGGIRADLVPGALVVPHQLIDYSWGREQSFADGIERADARVPSFAHIDFGEPFSEDLRKVLIASVQEQGLPWSDRAVYAVTQGPRLETAAEIDKLERDGCDIVGMTLMPEAALARELGLQYASLCLVVNPAAGRSAAPITLDDIHAVLEQGMAHVRRVLEQVVADLQRQG